MIGTVISRVMFRMLLVSLIRVMLEGGNFGLWELE